MSQTLPWILEMRARLEAPARAAMAKRLGRPLADGDIAPACQQSCPAQAIVFGDLNDPKSRVAKLAKLDRKYALLGEIGTQPRTVYLAKVRNPNADLEG